MIINNSISQDTDGERTERLTILSANIDDFAVELGITGARLQWAQGADMAWLDAIATAGVEDGQMDEAFETYHQGLHDAAEYYSGSKQYLLAIIYELEKPDDIIKGYEFDKPAPRHYSAIIAAITQWKRNHDYLEGEGDPRIVNDTIMDQLVAHRDNVMTLRENAFKEETESDNAFAAKHDLKESDEKAMALLLNLCKLTWGDDDSRLKLLGFLPSSEIWTENKPPHPTNFAHDGMKFTWDAVADVDEYEIDYRLTGASGDWTQLYKGAATSTVGEPAEPGEFDFRIRSWKGDDSGAWSGVIVVNFSGGALVGVPTGFTFDDAKQFFVWDDVVAALLYELEISRDSGQTWVQKYKDVDRCFEAGHLDTGKALARVRALDGYQEPGEWTEPLEVTFVLLAPAFVAYSQYKNEFVWNWVPLATRYELEISPDGMNWTMLYDGPNNHVVKQVAQGDWKVRVRAVRDEQPEVFSAWSKVVPVNIVLNQPGDLCYKEVEMRIQWDMVQGAAQYQLMNESHTVNYIGADNHLDIELTGQEKFRVRAGDGTMLVWGEWSAWTTLG